MRFQINQTFARATVDYYYKGEVGERRVRLCVFSLQVKQTFCFFCFLQQWKTIFEGFLNIQTLPPHRWPKYSTNRRCILERSFALWADQTRQVSSSTGSDTFDDFARRRWILNDVLAHARWSGWTIITIPNLLGNALNASKVTACKWRIRWRPTTL